MWFFGGGRRGYTGRVTETTFSLERPGAVLRGRAWLPERAVGLALVEHGMAEHAGRYAPFARYLAGRGWAVFAYDKRGHGATAGAPGSPEFARAAGWFAARGGWGLMVADGAAVLDWVADGAGGLAPAGLPLVLFGHSMGSLGLRALVASPGFDAGRVAGCVLSGTAGPAGLAGVLGGVLCRLAKARGHLRTSPFLERLFFGSHAKRAAAPARPRTPLDWLSSDPAAVERYRADPYCGISMRAGFFLDMLGGLGALRGRAYRRRFPRGLPFLLLSGADDPVGGMGAGVRKVYADFLAWGAADVELWLYPGRRHELLNEPIEAELFPRLEAWMRRRLEKAAAAARGE